MPATPRTARRATRSPRRRKAEAAQFPEPPEDGQGVRLDRLLKLPVRTNASQRAVVRGSPSPRAWQRPGERQFAIISRANGKLRVWLSGQPAKVRLKISAPETDLHGLPVEEGLEHLSTARSSAALLRFRGLNR